MLETLRPILDLPWAYQLWDRVIGANEFRRTLVAEYIRPQQNENILDIACGPGTMVPFLPSSEYVGFDASPDYIRRAQRRFPSLNFICDRVSEHRLPGGKSFDIVLALGVVHHLDDSEATQLFEIAHDALKPGGRLVTFDGVWVSNQSEIAKVFLKRDRGRFVRRKEKYLELASKSFSNIKETVSHDMLRIPYSHLILQCYR